MEIANQELAALRVTEAERDVAELNELQLLYVAGGVGEVIIG